MSLKHIIAVLLYLTCFLAATIGAAGQVDGSSRFLDAQWIWQQSEGPSNTWMAFRKEFDLLETPADALARISTDTKYWLWVNGELIVFEGGLARGPSRNGTYYDEIDLKPHLKSGRNTLAVLVWHWGKTAKTHDDSGKGGLLFSADLGRSIVKSDRNWRLKAHPAYDPGSKGLNRSANRANAMDVKYDARKALGDWTESAWWTPGYEMDASWRPATEKGAASSLPWGELVKRPIPQWNDRGLADYEALRIGKTEISLPYAVSAESSVSIFGKLPVNRQVTPYLLMKSKSGKVVEIGTDNPFNLINAQYIAREGVQAFEAYSWMNGNEVKYTIPPDVEILGLKYRWTGLGSVAGKFECSDPFFQRLWWMAANTLYICARDCYMDCPDRERGLWLGDVADQTGAVFYTLDKAGRSLLKKGIDNTIAYQDSDILQGLAPGFGEYRGKSSELTAQSLQYIDQGIWRYYFNTGDEGTLENAYPSVRAYLRLWNMLPTGLPEIRKGYASWVDWGTHADCPPVEVCWYYLALNAARKMAIELRQSGDIEWYDERIASIGANFRKVYWRDGYYGTKGAKKDERVSALAILSGLADESEYQDLVRNVLAVEYNASPHMEWMVQEAMMLAGDHAAGLKRMRERYAAQVNDESITTLCERFGERRGTYNHAWNAPNYVLSRYIAGISATDVAWKEYQVLPRLVHMTSVSQRVPSVKGEISIDMRMRGKTFEMDLTSPKGTMATVGIPKSAGRISRVTANGELIWDIDGFLEGSHDIAGAGENDAFLLFRVPPGEWKISAIAF